MLDLSILPNVKQRGNKTIAACPACRAAGRDKTGNHLFINSLDGSKEYGCVAHEKDKQHNKEIFSLVGIKTEPTQAEKVEWAKQKALSKARDQAAAKAAQEQKELTQKLIAQRPAIYQKYGDPNWSEIYRASSPLPLESWTPTPEHALMRHLCFYIPNSWMGDVGDSGSACHAANFKPMKDRLREERLPPRFSLGTYKTGSISRSLKNILDYGIIATEFDDLDPDPETNKSKSYAIIEYMRDMLKLTLMAVVGSGNKSLHAYWIRPPDDAMGALLRMAEGLGIDENHLKQSSHRPLRLPGTIHHKTGRPAELFYLNT